MSEASQATESLCGESACIRQLWVAENDVAFLLGNPANPRLRALFRSGGTKQHQSSLLFDVNGLETGSSDVFVGGAILMELVRIVRLLQHTGQ